MNPNQARIAMAEVDGWTDIIDRGNAAGFNDLLGTTHEPEWREDTPLPDYPNDRDACMAVARKLAEADPGFSDLFGVHLADLCNVHTCRSVQDRTYRIATADNATYIEAILRAVGKYDDTL